MKLIIAGGRDYVFSQNDIDRLNAVEGVTEVVSGGAPGADSGGEAWATEADIPVKRFPADWKSHGRAAGPVRNRKMAEYADAVALFPGGRGTASMQKEAVKHNLVIFDWRDN